MPFATSQDLFAVLRRTKLHNYNSSKLSIHDRYLRIRSKNVFAPLLGLDNNLTRKKRDTHEILSIESLVT